MLSEKEREEVEEVALAMVFCMSEKVRDEAEEVVFTMVFSVSEKERDEAEDYLKAMVFCVTEKERIVRGHGVLCEWERERRSWRGWKENEKEVFCVGHGGLEQNSVRVICF